MTAVRDQRIGVRVTGAELDTLRRRAAAHTIPVAAYVRRVALDDVHGLDPDTPSGWWLALGAERQRQVHRWLRDTDPARPFPGQMPFDADEVTR